MHDGGQLIQHHGGFSAELISHCLNIDVSTSMRRASPLQTATQSKEDASCRSRA
jgi:hypothetical protein